MDQQKNPSDRSLTLREITRDEFVRPNYGFLYYFLGMLFADWTHLKRGKREVHGKDIVDLITHVRVCL